MQNVALVLSVFHVSLIKNGRQLESVQLEAMFSCSSTRDQGCKQMRVLSRHNGSPNHSSRCGKKLSSNLAMCSYV